VNVTTIVKIDTDDGISGFGEVCPMGTHYMRGFGEAAAAGVPLLAKMILGEDPFQVEKLNRMWDVKFKDDIYVKAPVDVAPWDIIGKSTGGPVCHLLGGHYSGAIPLYRTVHLFAEHEDTPQMWVRRCADYRAMGIRHFQIKGGGDVGANVAMIEAVCDALQPGE